MFKEEKKILIRRTLLIYLKWKVLLFKNFNKYKRKYLVIFNYVFLNEYKNN